MKKRLFFLILLFVCSIEFLSGCTEKDKKEDLYKELRIGTGWDATRPGDYQPYGMWEPAALIYETLVNLDKNCSTVPCLADKWEISDDSLNYTFYLHKGVKFHDKTDFNAHAVKTNFEKLGRINWLALKRVVDAVEIIDEYTVSFHLLRPSPLFLFYLAGSSYGIIAPSAIKEKKSQAPAMNASDTSMDKQDKKSYLVAKAMGTGPYKWDEQSYKRARSFGVVRNENYWRKDPVFEKIRWRVIPDPVTRTIALESGEIDMTGQSPNASLLEENIFTLKQNKKIKLKKANNWGARLVVINHTRPPFDNINVRRAIGYAIDYSNMSKIFSELAVICPGPLGPNTPFTNPDIKFSKYDPDKAKNILNNMGIIDTDGDGFREYKGETIKISILISKSKGMGLVLCEFLENIGFKADLRPKESGAIFKILENMNYDIAVHPNIPSFYLDLYGTFHSKGRWAIRLNDPETDKMLDQYIVCSDLKKFKELSFQIQKKIADKKIILFAINECKLAAYNKKLGEFIFPPEEWVGALQEVWRME